MTINTDKIQSLLQQRTDEETARKIAKRQQIENFERDAQAFIDRSAHTIFVNMKTGYTSVRPTYRMVSLLTGRTVRQVWPTYFDVRWLGSEDELTAIHLLTGGKRRAEGIAGKITHLYRTDKRKSWPDLIRYCIAAVQS